MKPLVSRGIAPSAGWAGVLALLAASAASAAAPPCRPCGGVEVADPRPLVDQLNAAPRLAAEERLYVAWPAELSARRGPEAALLLEPVVSPEAAELDAGKLDELRALGYGGE